MCEDGPARKKRNTDSVLGISRSIAACQRCRKKKTKCDQKYPKCTRCLKAGVDCVSIDPATGREVARLYVYQLEERIAELEEKLHKNGVDSAKLPVETNSPPSPSSPPPPVSHSLSYVAPTMGHTFALLMITANKMSSSLSALRQDPLGLTLMAAEENVSPAVLPSKAMAMEFIKTFFAQSNSQLPILHRETFLKDTFLPIYGEWDDSVSLASDYSQVNKAVYQDSVVAEEETWFFQYKQVIQAKLAVANGKMDAIEATRSIEVPPQFHRPLFSLNMIFAISSSVNHLQYHNSMSGQFKKAAMMYTESSYSSEDPLEQLESILLHALYSVMRPNVPGVWYLLGTALRICVDLGLHREDSTPTTAFVKDRRRRLFWCTYSLDRQICFYLGRPVGLSDGSITTRYPSELEDACITPGDTETKDYSDQSGIMPSYKHISLAFFQVRQIQLECQKVLYENGELPRRFDSLEQWKQDMNRRLHRWRKQCPKNFRRMNTKFTTDFFDLNYNHTLLQLHGLSSKTIELTHEAYHTILDALKNLMGCYTKLFIKKAINYTWAAVHNLFMAGTSYLFVLYNSELVRNENPHEEVARVTENCLVVLSLLIDSCAAAQACMETFQMLLAVVWKLRYSSEAPEVPANLPKTVSHVEAPNGNLASLVQGITNEQHRHSDCSEVSANTDPDNKSMPFVTETYLDDFFVELENVAPMAEPVVIQPQEDGTDGRRVFELINQMPSEAIWDQFFTNLRQ